MLWVRSTASALVASLLAKDVLAAAVHRLHHERLHNRAIYTVFDDVVETVYSTVYVTIDEYGTGSSANPTPQVYKDKPVVAVAVPTTSSTSSPADTTPQGYNVVDSVPASSSTSTSLPVVAVPTTLSTSTTPPPPAVIVPTTTSMPAAVVPPTTSTPVVVVPTTTSTPVVVAPTTTSTPAIVPATTSTKAVVSPVEYAVNTASSASTGKRGLAYNSATLCSGFVGSSLVSWAYNWGSTTSGLNTAFEYVPMLWGLGTDHTNGWAQAAESAIASGSTHLLSFNEPDNAGQSNLDCNTAASGYMTYMQPFAGKAKLGSPAVTNGGPPSGLTWLSSFLSLCTNCHIDFITCHWYDSATNFEYFKQYLQDAYKAGGGRPIWLTEFGASGTLDEQVTFLQVVMPWMDAQPWIERYAYYMVDQGSLISSGGNSLSSLGSTFMTYTSNTISPQIAN